MRINYNLFDKVKAHILEEPKSLRQECWIRRKPDDENYSYSTYRYIVENGTKEPKCGTLACVAGWAVLITHGPNFVGNVSKTALLDLIHGDGTTDIKTHNARQALYEKVFMFFPEDDHLKPGTVKYAKAVIKRIDDFLEEWGSRKKK